MSDDRRPTKKKIKEGKKISTHYKDKDLTLNYLSRKEVY